MLDQNFHQHLIRLALRATFPLWGRLTEPPFSRPTEPSAHEIDSTRRGRRPRRPESPTERRL